MWLKVGVARGDITPELPIDLVGYSRRAENVNKVRRPLLATVLVFDDDSNRIAIVSMDILALAMPEVSFECGDNKLTAIAPATVTGADLTWGILPVLLESKVDVLEIRRGTSLEEAFMSTRRLNTDSGVWA